MNIIEQLIPETAGEVPTPAGNAVVNPYQVLVTVSIVARTVLELPVNVPRFPAVLDTGYNHNFAIRQEHWEQWTGLVLPQRGLVRVGGYTVPLLMADIWIHPNPEGKPLRLRLEEGVAVYPADVPNPARLPILGLRGLVRNGLKLVIDGKKREVMLSQ